MSKISFSKLKLTKNNEVTIIHFNEEIEIEVKQYLSLGDKLDLMDAVIGLAGDEQGFFNIVKLRVLYEFKMLQEYTNINFTAKQEEEIGKTYDIIYLNNIWGQVATAIPEIERDFIWNNILELARSATEYNSSALGIIRNISENYDETSFGLNKIMEQFGNPQMLQTLKEIAPVVAQQQKKN